MSEKRFDNLDGLRTIACFGIILMHIRANTAFVLPAAMDTFVMSLTHFVALFLMISGFGMFCGYYDRFKDGKMDLNSFYTKRYKKILPFFAILIVLDLVIDFSIKHLIEGLTELTLIFGLLPNNEPEVIGVSWTLGVIFLFYMLFPFMVFLCYTKRRAWISFGISIALSLFCSFYFFTDKFVIAGFSPRHNFLYCLPWFLAGGLVYLYIDNIKAFISKIRWIWLLLCISLSVGWYFTPSHIGDADIYMLKNLFVFMPWLMYAVSVKSSILSNKAASFFSSISLEIYLAHMVCFRVLERLKLIYIAGKGPLGLIVIWSLVVAILAIAIWIYKYLTGRIFKSK